MSYEHLLGDKEWRVEHLYSIVDKNLHKVVFKKNKAQRDFDKKKHTRNIILKSRRLGFTTYEAIDNLDDTLFTRNFSSLFMAHTQNDAIEIFDKKVDAAWKNFDPELAKLWRVDNSASNKLKFDLGNNNFSSILVSNSGRSGTNNRVHCSEYAKLCVKFPSKADEFITGTIPSVPPEGRIDIEGTAEGMAGNFYDMFWEAWNRGREPMQLEFKAHFYNWQWDEEEINKITVYIPTSEMEQGSKFAEYQKAHNLTDQEITYYYEKWLSLKKDWEMLHQEYPTTPEEAFVASGNTFFNKERITYLSTDTPKKIEVDKFSLPEKLLKYYIDGTLSIYEKPQDLGSYVTGGDVAEGKGQDSSSCVCINNKTLKPAAEFDSNKIRPDEYAEFLNALGRYYNTAYLAVESNSGLWVLTELLETYQYPNLYWREAIDDVSHTVNKRLGFSTSGLSRKPMLDNLLVQVNLYEGIWTSKFLQECLVFVKNEMGRPEAMEGKHDDMVIAYGICHYVRDNAVSEKQAPQGEPKTSQERIMQRLEKLKGSTNEISQDFYI